MKEAIRADTRRWRQSAARPAVWFWPAASRERTRGL